MADQMLTLARAEPANGLVQEFARHDFAELVYDVTGELAALALKKNIELSFEGATNPVFIDGNATLLREMISNLIDNALRHTQDSVHVSINGEYSEAILSIVDNGPGIPEAEREKVFQRFYRILGHGDSEGSGLGLAIVREICWAHGGKITLSANGNDCGLAVKVTLPLAPRR